MGIGQPVPVLGRFRITGDEPLTCRRQLVQLGDGKRDESLEFPYDGPSIHARWGGVLDRGEPIVLDSLLDGRAAAAQELRCLGEGVRRGQIQMPSILLQPNWDG